MLGFSSAAVPSAWSFSLNHMQLKHERKHLQEIFSTGLHKNNQPCTASVKRDRTAELKITM